jgi:hypothetical protein
MSHWMLTPTDHCAEIWKTYAVQRIVVEAPNERSARERVAKTAPTAAHSNPWLDPVLSSCKQVDSAPGAATG